MIDLRMFMLALPIAAASAFRAMLIVLRGVEVALHG